MKGFRYPLYVLACAMPALAQAPRLSFGAVGGVPLSNGGQSEVGFQARPYTVGPSIEFALSQRVSVTFNALYRRLRWTQTFANVGGDALRASDAGASYCATLCVSRARGHSWEFPVMGKYYFDRRIRNPRPFLEAGISFSSSWLTFDDVTFGRGIDTGGILSQSLLSDSWPPSSVGPVFGGGVAWKAGRLTLAPEVRYSSCVTQFDGANRRQVGFLIGLRF